MPHKKPRLEFEGIPGWLINLAALSLLWLLVGIGIAGALYVFNFSATISIPFLVALVLAIISFPLIELGDKIKLPRALSASITLVLIFAFVWGAVQITVVGVANQTPMIKTQVANAIHDVGGSVAGSLEAFGITRAQVNNFTYEINKAVANPSSLIHNTSKDITNKVDGANNQSGSNSFFNPDTISQIGSSIASGAASLAGLLTGVGSFAFGLFIGALLLYYMLVDYEKLILWAGSHIGVDSAMGAGLIEDLTDSLRGYFKGTTLTALVVALGIGIGLAILKVPLVIPIIIVTFITAYIPFFGAIISAAFACLIAFGSGGWTVALIVLVIVLVTQNVLQQIVQAKFLGDSLDLHPIAVLAATIAGSVFAGLLGATLAAPTLAMALRTRERLELARQFEEDGCSFEDFDRTLREKRLRLGEKP